MLRRVRRVLKLILIIAISSIVFLSFSASLAFPRQQNLHIDAALDAVLHEYLDHLPATSARRHCSIHDSQAKPPKSPRAFPVPEKYTSQHVAKACEVLSAKKILLVGPETTYYLHSLWLHALKTHEHRTHFCHGPEFCKFHHICVSAGSPNTHTDRYKVPPKDEDLVATSSALMRYVLSTSLYTAPDKNDSGYTQEVVDPATGIRLKNAYWLVQARKADIVLMNRGPIPAPAWTFAGHKTRGNWSFTAELPRHLDQGNSLAEEIVNAAFHTTVTRFIPEVLQSLRAVQKDPLIRQKTLAWPASWFFGFVDFYPPRTVEDPWALYYNAQVYMQNYLLKALLPHHGVHFLPGIAPSLVVADFAPAGPHGSQDKLRFPLGTSNAQAMEAAFLKSLIELIECVK